MNFRKTALLFGVAILHAFFPVDALIAQNISPGNPLQQSPVGTPRVNNTFYPGLPDGWYPTIQFTVTDACAKGGGTVDVQGGSTPTDTIAAVTGGCTTVGIIDHRVVPSVQYAWNGTAYAVTGSGGSVTAGAMQAALTSQTGCTTSGFVWIPASNTCVAQSAGAGTVTHSTGALTANHVVIGNGAGDVKSDTGCATDGAGNQTCNSFTSSGSTSGGQNFTYTGTPAPAPTTNQFQVSPAVPITTPWSYSPAAAPGSGFMKGTNASGVVQQSFESQVNLAADVTGVLAPANIPAATATTVGGVIPGTGCSMSGSTLNCPGSGGLPSGNGIIAVNSGVGALATTNQVNTALGTNPGLFVFGDSISTGTGATSSSSRIAAMQNGYSYLLQVDIGGPMLNPSIPGFQVANQNWLEVWRNVNPIGDGLDPVTVSEIGTNDATNYGANTNQQNIFNRLMLADLVITSVPRANKVYAQACTLAGGAVVQTTPLQVGMGVLMVNNGAATTCSVASLKASDSLYACYDIADGSGGTFTLSVDGTLQNDPFNGTTTWVTQGDGGALIQTTGTTPITKNGVACARLTGFAAGTHIVKWTVTSATSTANPVMPEFAAAAPVNASTLPLVIAVSPNQQQSGSAGAPFAATYAGFISTIVSNLQADGLNVKYADTSNALLNDPTCGNGVQATMFANCYSDNLHPNDPGHLVMKKTIETQIPSALLTGISHFNQYQPGQKQLYSLPINPNFMFNLNPFGLQPSGTAFGPGISWGCVNGSCYYMDINSTTGLSVVSSGFISFCTGGTSGVTPVFHPLTANCGLQVSSNGAIIANNAFQLLNDTSGPQPTGTATSSTNFASHRFCWQADVWRTDSTLPAAAPICFAAVPQSPTGAGVTANNYMTLIDGSGFNVHFGLDLSATTLPNHLGAADATSLSVAGLPITARLTGTTAAIGGSALAAGACSTGTASVPGAVVGHTVGVSAVDGSLPNPLVTSPYATVTAINTVTVQICAIAAVTPTAVAYNVTTY